MTTRRTPPQREDDDEAALADLEAELEGWAAESVPSDDEALLEELERLEEAETDLDEDDAKLLAELEGGVPESSDEEGLDEEASELLKELEDWEGTETSNTASGASSSISSSRASEMSKASTTGSARGGAGSRSEWPSVSEETKLKTTLCEEQSWDAVSARIQDLRKWLDTHPSDDKAARVLRKAQLPWKNFNEIAAERQKLQARLSDSPWILELDKGEVAKAKQDRTLKKDRDQFGRDLHRLCRRLGKVSESLREAEKEAYGWGWRLKSALGY